MRVFSPERETSSSAAAVEIDLPRCVAICCTRRGSSQRLVPEQSITAFLSSFATALYRRVFLASESAMMRQTVVGLGLARYSTSGSETDLASFEQPSRITRRNSLPMGKVLSEPMIDSISGSLDMSRSSRLNSTMPDFSKRAFIRETAWSRLTPSVPTIRYAGSRPFSDIALPSHRPSCSYRDILAQGPTVRQRRRYGRWHRMANPFAVGVMVMSPRSIVHAKAPPASLTASTQASDG